MGGARHRGVVHATTGYYYLTLMIKCHDDQLSIKELSVYLNRALLRKSTRHKVEFISKFKTCSLWRMCVEDS